MKKYTLTLIFLYLSATTNPFYCIENKEKKENTLKISKKRRTKINKKLAKSNVKPDKSQTGQKETEIPNWSSHNFKHFAPKSKSWGKKQIKTNKKAVYRPDLDIEKLERMIWSKGTSISDEQKVMEFDTIIGASSGKETRYSRVEINSLNTIHGRPLSPKRAKNLLIGITKTSLKPYIKGRQPLAETSD